MIRLFRFLITGDWHLHKWEQLRAVDIFSSDLDERPYGRRYECVCEVCGVIRKFSM